MPIMSTWDARLIGRQLPIKVAGFLKKEPRVMVIVDAWGQQHQLSITDFTHQDWANIDVGSIITLTISESVTGWRVKPSRIRKSIEELIAEARKKVSEPFFIWICQYCGTTDCVAYEDGDDPRGIAERILSAHNKEAKPGCRRRISIFDHRGVKQENSTLFISLVKAK